MAIPLSTPLQGLTSHDLDDAIGLRSERLMPHQRLIRDLNTRIVELEQQNARLREACDRYRDSLRKIHDEVRKHAG